MLLVDDVQFLQAKVRTEEEFFHTFNALHQAGAQIVLTSDRLPRDLGDMESRLRERFEAGLVTDVRAPDASTRLTILRKRAQQDAIAGLDGGALELIADRVTDNVRALEGALIRVVAFGSLTGRPVTPELVEEVLAGLYPERRARHRATVEEIQRQTAEAFGISVEALRLAPAAPPASPGPGSSRCTSRASSPTRRCPAIGRAFGGRTAHDRPPRPPQDRRAHRRRPRGLRGRPPAHRGAGPPVTPRGMTDCGVPVHSRRQRDSRTQRDFRRLVHTIDTHMTLIRFREYLSESIAKQATR